MVQRPASHARPAPPRQPVANHLSLKYTARHDDSGPQASEELNTDGEESRRRWLPIERELDALEDRRAIVGEDTYRDLLEALLQEQDDLEYEAGEEDARARSV